MSRWGRGRACFRGVTWVSSPGEGHLSQTPWLQGSHFARAGRGLEGSISCCFLATFSTNFTSEIPGTNHYFTKVISFPALSVGNQPGEAPNPRSKGARGRDRGERGSTQSFPNPLVYPHPLPGLSHSLHPLHPQPRRFIPELTAWRRPERVKQK